MKALLKEADKTYFIPSLVLVESIPIIIEGLFDIFSVKFILKSSPFAFTTIWLSTAL